MLFVAPEHCLLDCELRVGQARKTCLYLEKRVLLLVTEQRLRH